MICRPLARLGYDVHGIDIDAASIEHGQDPAARGGPRPRDPGGAPAVRGRPGARRPDRVGGARAPARRRARRAARRDAGAPAAGRPLLVTVPNGYGWFELEQFLWWRAGLGRLLFRSGFCHFVEKTKSRWLGAGRGRRPARPRRCRARRTSSGSLSRGSHGGCRPPASTSSSARGSVVFSGPFSNLLFAGVEPVLGGERTLGRSPGSDRLGLLPRLPAEALSFICWLVRLFARGT